MITQGPWKWHKRKYSNTHFLANESETNDDFAIIDDGSAYGEYGAVIDVSGGNARLIAAAPELLEALRQLRDYVEDVCAVSSSDCDKEHPLMLATAAIKKAMGE